MPLGRFKETRKSNLKIHPLAHKSNLHTKSDSQSASTSRSHRCLAEHETFGPCTGINRSLIILDFAAAK